MFTIHTTLRRMACFCTLRPGPFFPHPAATTPSFSVPGPSTCLCPCHPTTPLPRAPNRRALTLDEQLSHIDTSLGKISAFSKAINNRQIALEEARAVHDRQHPPQPPSAGDDEQDKEEFECDVEGNECGRNVKEGDAWAREQPQRPCECRCSWGRKIEGERRMLVGLYARTWFAWHFYDHWRRRTTRALVDGGLVSGRRAGVEMPERGDRERVTWGLVHGKEEEDGEWGGVIPWFGSAEWIERMPGVGWVDEEAERRRERARAAGEGRKKRRWMG